MTAEQIARERLRLRKLQAEDEAFDAIAKARENKAFLDLEQQRAHLGFQIAKLKYQNFDYGSLNSELKEVCEKLREVQKEMGITDESLRPAYRCPKCEDTGYVNGKQCDCLKTEIFRILQENCAWKKTEEYRLNTLPDALPEARKESYKKFASFLESYRDNFPNVAHVLFVTGKPASGKTYALTVLANALMYAGYSALIYSSYKLNQFFLDYHLAPLERKREILRPLLDVDFLMIDDIGAENILNNVTLPYLQMLLDLREGPIAFTSNLDAGQLLSRYGERITGRLLEKENSKAALLSGYDFRLKINH